MFVAGVQIDHNTIHWLHAPANGGPITHQQWTTTGFLSLTDVLVWLASFRSPITATVVIEGTNKQNSFAFASPIWWSDFSPARDKPRDITAVKVITPRECEAAEVEMDSNEMARFHRYPQAYKALQMARQLAA